MGWFGSNTEDNDRDKAKENVRALEEQVGKICGKLESDTMLNKHEVATLKATYDAVDAFCSKYGHWELRLSVDKVFQPVYEAASARLSRQECEWQQRRKSESERGKREFYQQKKRASERKLDESNRLKIERQHGKLLDSVTELMSASSSPYTESMRGAVALGGAEFMSPESMVLWDMKQLFIKLSLASSASNDTSKAVALGKLFHGIRVRLEPTTECTLSESQADLVGEHLDLTLPGMVAALVLYDTLERTQLASKAALTYRSIAVTAANLCGNSFGVKLVTNAYLELLKPYIPQGSDDERAGCSNSSSSSGRSVSKNFDELVRSYEILGVRADSTDEEVKSAYRNLAKVWHPDRFSKENDSLRGMAENKFKEVNEAYELLCKARPVTSTSQSAETPVVSVEVQAIVAATNSILQKASEYNRRLDAFFARLKGGLASTNDWKEILARQVELEKEIKRELNFKGDGN